MIQHLKVRVFSILTLLMNCLILFYIVWKSSNPPSDADWAFDLREKNLKTHDEVDAVKFTNIFIMITYYFMFSIALYPWLYKWKSCKLQVYVDWLNASLTLKRSGVIDCVGERHTMKAELNIHCPVWLDFVRFEVVDSLMTGVYIDDISDYTPHIISCPYASLSI